MTFMPCRLGTAHGQPAAIPIDVAPFVRLAIVAFANPSATQAARQVSAWSVDMQRSPKASRQRPLEIY